MPNNIQLIRQAIQEKNAQWSAKETNLSQLSVENKRAMLGAVEDTELINSVQYKEKASEAIHPKISIPTHFDWRERGKVSQVKDQLVCGSCVSFATAGLLESMALIEKDIELDLSEADLHFCSAHGPDCSGWYTRKALDSVNERGVCFEGLFTYAEGYNNEHPKCKIHANRDGALLKIEETDWFVRDISRKESIATHGPLVASFSVYEDFYYYGSGIYRHVYGDYMAGHAVLVVGYSDSEQCWICKNSWGENWGDNGYFKIAYGECSIDDLSSPFWSASKVTIKLRGNVQNHVVHDDGSIGALKGYYQWTNGWTSAGFYTAGSDTYLFILKAKGFGSDGNNVHIHKMNSDGTLGDQVEAHRWTEGWTSAEFYTAGSNTYLFILKAKGFGSDGNNVHIHKMNSDGTLGNQVEAHRWTEGRRSAEFYTAGSNTYLFILKAKGFGSDGNNVHIHKMNSDGTLGDQVEAHRWTEGWTSAEFYTAGSNTYLFILKAKGFGSDGNNVHIHKMNSDGTLGDQVEAHRWTEGWTSAEFYTAGSNTYLFILKAKGFGSDGNNVHIHKMNSDGTLGNQVEAHRWTEGWTTAQLYTTGSNKTQLFCLKKTWMTQVNVKFKRVKVLDVPLGENGKADMKLTFYVNGQKKTWPSSATYRTVSEGNTYNIGEEFEVRLMEFEQLSIIVSGIDVDRGDADGIPPDDKMGSIAKIFDHSDNWGSGTKNDKNDFYRIYYQISIVE
ncbi:MAG: hypothetical protein H6657_18010 [Ardenticatenaceae bacterium]|nr:hypothetical protein [Ardenticatenaceae bacterium]